MKKCGKGIILLSIMFLLVGCQKEEENNSTIQERKVTKLQGTHTLECNGKRKVKSTTTSVKAKIKYDYDTNTLKEGKIQVMLNFSKKLTEEDKINLKDFSYCSSDSMGELVSFGTCTTELKEKELISTLEIDSSKIPKEMNLERIKIEMESNSIIPSTCTIK